MLSLLSFSPFFSPFFLWFSFPFSLPGGLEELLGQGDGLLEVAYDLFDFARIPGMLLSFEQGAQLVELLLIFGQFGLYFSD